MAQQKEFTCQCRCGFNPWVSKIPWRRKWQPVPVFLLGKSHGQRTLVGYSPWGLKELDTTERLTLSDKPITMSPRHICTKKLLMVYQKPKPDVNWWLDPNVWLDSVNIAFKSSSVCLPCKPPSEATSLPWRGQGISQPRADSRKGEKKRAPGYVHVKPTTVPSAN